MPFLYLITAHIVGDFILQPKSLVKWKEKSHLGLIIHSFIQFALVFFVLALISNKTLQMLGIALMVGVSHYYIDMGKIKFNAKHKKQRLAFFVDQGVHILILFLVYLLLILA